MQGSSYICLNVKCSKPVVSGIECEICKCWAHKKCSKLSNEVYQLHCTHPDLTWICERCKDIAKVAVSRSNSTLTPVTPIPTSLTPCTPCSPALKKSYATVSRARMPLTPANHTVIHRAPVLQSTPIDYSPWRTQTSKKPRQTPTQSGLNRKSKSTSPCSPIPEEVIKGKMTSQPKTTSHTPRTQGSELISAISRIEKHENRLEQLTRSLQVKLHEVKQLQTAYESTLGRSRNIMIRAPEPVINNTAKRLASERNLIRCVLRNAGCHPKLTWKRAHRIGKWNRPSEIGNHPTRALLVEFHNTKDRDLVLSKAEIISAAMTNVTIEADGGSRPSHVRDQQPVQGSPLVVAQRIPRMPTVSPSSPHSRHQSAPRNLVHQDYTVQRSSSLCSQPKNRTVPRSSPPRE